MRNCFCRSCRSPSARAELCWRVPSEETYYAARAFVPHIVCAVKPYAHTHTHAHAMALLLPLQLPTSPTLCCPLPLTPTRLLHYTEKETVAGSPLLDGGSSLTCV